MHQPCDVEGILELYASQPVSPKNNLITYAISDTILNDNVMAAMGLDHAMNAKVIAMKLLLFLQIHMVMNHPEVSAQIEAMHLRDAGIAAH